MPFYLVVSPWPIGRDMCENDIDGLCYVEIMREYDGFWWVNQGKGGEGPKKYRIFGGKPHILRPCGEER